MMKNSTKDLPETNTEKRKKIAARYKKGYGNKQSGSGRALLVKDIHKQRFTKFRQNEEHKKNKRLQYMQSHGITPTERATVTDDQLSYLPAVAALESEPVEAEEVNPHKPEKKKLSKLMQAKIKFKQIKEEKANARREREQRKMEREQKWKDRKDQRLKKNMKLSQKTKKGQPVMRARMDLLLEDIQKLVS